MLGRWSGFERYWLSCCVFNACFGLRITPASLKVKVHGLSTVEPNLVVAGFGVVLLGRIEIYKQFFDNKR